ncbi:MAG: septum formation initiator family protein [Candidatus Cloacimonetes bacterium]|nr:septum formation initiator family protein [Candidatus Cloacimonadota bacterium]MDD4155873.1 septum formation initiator family protein [Candidatus Cloacimonadota bacterium]
MNKMLTFTKKNSQFNLYTKKIFAFLLTISSIVLTLYLFLSIMFFHEFSFINLINERKETFDLDKKVVNINKENDRYIEENKKLKDDPFFIESIARKDYLMVKEGEQVYIFKSDK